MAIINEQKGRLYNVLNSKKKLKKIFFPIILLAAYLFCACQDDLTETPSFIHVDSITLRVPDENAVTLEPGFYTSDIVAAYVVLHAKGESKVDTIGLFRLPFTAPVLRSGEMDYIEIAPAIEQSGSSKALPFYTFYERITFNNPVLKAGDTLDFGALTTTYESHVDVLMYQLFETEATSQFGDELAIEHNDTEGACSGQGYGYMHLTADQYSKEVEINRTFDVYDRTKLLYLELDSRGDLDFEVYMTSRYMTGGSTDKQPVMVVRKTDDWEHLYINLGRTWSYFGYFHEFKLSIVALNPDGVEGDIRLDNVRLLTTTVVL